jgi:hypothetical protein
MEAEGMPPIFVKYFGWLEKTETKKLKIWKAC